MSLSIGWLEGVVNLFLWSSCLRVGELGGDQDENGYWRLMDREREMGKG